MTRDDIRLRVLTHWLPRIPAKHADAAWVLGVIILVAGWLIAEAIWWPRG